MDEGERAIPLLNVAGCTRRCRRSALSEAPQQVYSENELIRAGGKRYEAARLAYKIVEARLCCVGAFCPEIGCRTVKLRIIFDLVDHDQECGLDIEVKVDLDDAASVAEIKRAAFNEARSLLAIASASSCQEPFEKSAITAGGELDLNPDGTIAVYPVVRWWPVGSRDPRICLLQIAYVRDLSESEEAVKGGRTPRIPLGLTPQQCRTLAVDLLNAATALDGGKELS